MMPNNLVKDYLWLHLVVLIWSFTAILGLLISLSSVEIVFFRTLLASMGLFVFLKYKGIKLRVNLKVIFKLLGVGCLIGAHWILFFWSAQVSTASVCLVGMATCSLWTAFVEPLVNKSSIKWYEVLLGLLAVVGLYVIFKFETGYWLGLYMAISSAFIGAWFMVINGRLTKNHSPFVITFYEMIGACLFSILLLPAYSIYFAEGEVNLSPSGWDWFWLLVLSQVCTVFAFSVSVELMKRLTAFAINLTVNMEPVYGIVMAFIVFGEKERMSGEFYLGTLIILLSVCLYPPIHYLQRRKVTRQLRRMQ